MISRYTVIGDPVAHSLSPQMHNAAFQAAGLDALYDRSRVKKGELETFLLKARTALRGFNVTVPWKEEVIRCLDDCDDDVRATGAANTVVVHDGHLHGANTDVAGFGRAVNEAGISLRGRQAIVLGAGGAARAVVYALLKRNANVFIVARNGERARDVVSRFCSSVRYAGPNLSQDLLDRDTALVVNATPLGMSPWSEHDPLSRSLHLGTQLLLFDLVYGRETPFLARARSAGCAAVGGMNMLLYQGAAAFRLWTGLDPDVSVMKQALEAS